MPDEHNKLQLESIADALKLPACPTLDTASLAKQQEETAIQLQSIPDEDICTLKGLVADRAFYMLAIKYNIAPEQVFNYVHLINNALYFYPPSSTNSKANVHQAASLPAGTKTLDHTIADSSVTFGTVVRTLDNISHKLFLDFIHLQNNEIIIEGYSQFLNSFAAPELEVALQTENSTYSPSYRTRLDQRIVTPFHSETMQKLGFTFRIPWDGKTKLCITPLIFFQGISITATFGFGKFVGLNEKLAHTYWALPNVLITYQKDSNTKTLAFEPRTMDTMATYEEALRAELATKPEAAEILAWRKRGFNLLPYPTRERIWLLSDRPLYAGDNAEALFTYLQANPIKNIRPIFALSKESPHWERISQLGETIEYASDTHKELFLHASLIVSAAGDEYVINPFEDLAPYLKDLYRARYVFLQHGVGHNDMSKWLHRFRKNIELVITSAPREHDDFLQDYYGYAPENVLLCGIPRHDTLLEEAAHTQVEKTILLAPTWRQSLTITEPHTETGMRDENPNFDQSEYFQFFNGFINDSRLLNLLRTAGYKMRFIVHPTFLPEAHKFCIQDPVELVTECNYRSEFVHAACMITDYSSIAFDFALLHKPLIYAQFDADDFFATHLMSKGFFSFEKDSFGPICTTIEELIDCLDQTIATGCSMPEQYKQRVDAFFYKPDCPRCKIITDKLLELETKITNY